MQIYQSELEGLIKQLLMDHSKQMKPLGAEAN